MAENMEFTSNILIFVKYFSSIFFSGRLTEQISFVTNLIFSNCTNIKIKKQFKTTIFATINWAKQMLRHMWNKLIK